LKALKQLAAFVWYGAGVYLALSYGQAILVPAWPVAKGLFYWALFAKSLLGLALLIAFFILLHLTVRAAIGSTTPAPVTQTPSQAGEHFPSETTVVVGIWLVVLAAVSAAGLLLTLDTSCWPAWLKKCFENLPDFTNAVATMLGASVGSIITTILGYLEHASEKKDFERAYAPWHVGWPLMGMLLGLVFYFLLRGGLLAVVPNNAKPEDLSAPALAGVGALVGLFSKDAIEKLREVFSTLLSTEKQAEQSVLDRLPPDLKKQVAPIHIWRRSWNWRRWNWRSNGLGHQSMGIESA
jgi:hypothetical protein